MIKEEIRRKKDMKIIEESVAEIKESIAEAELIIEAAELEAELIVETSELEAELTIEEGELLEQKRTVWIEHAEGVLSELEQKEAGWNGVLEVNKLKSELKRVTAELKRAIAELKRVRGGK